MIQISGIEYLGVRNCQKRNLINLFNWLIQFCLLKIQDFAIKINRFFGIFESIFHENPFNILIDLDLRIKFVLSPLRIIF